MSRWGFHCVLSVLGCVLRNELMGHYSKIADNANGKGEQADKTEALEVEHGWKEEQFDFVLQFLRTILMKRKHSW